MCECFLLDVFVVYHVLCVFCSGTANHFPWEHMASYCNSYNNIRYVILLLHGAAASSDYFVSNSCIWVFWQGAIMKAYSRIKGAEFHMKHSSAQEKECRNSFGWLI